MKFSEKWLREWANPDISSEALQHQLTMSGLEVDGVEPAAGEFSQVVVGEIISVKQHPDADRLSVCEVNIEKSQPLTIVCGAKNVAKGMKVPVALVGATLPNGMHIKQSVLRGVTSCGMLCSAAELGLEAVANGIMELPHEAPVGEDIPVYLALDDRIIDLGLTPNRGDCLSILGVAREVSAMNRCELKSMVTDPVLPSNNNSLAIKIAASHACPRYIGRVITGFTSTLPSPLWLKERLRRSGLRSISAVVDITNYVLLELGQPMHAFDKDKLSGGITVRFAKNNEKLMLLDGKEINVDKNTLVIADDKRAIALAGIMGGKDTAVSDSTTTLFLESAYFSKQAIAGRARHYGLSTDSSHRFERGVDFQLQHQAMERATQLLLEIVGGSAGPLLEVSDTARLPVLPAIVLRRARLQRVLGIEIPDRQVEELLRRLGMTVTALDGEWHVVPPSYRFDIALEIDLIEEIARTFGYENIPAELQVSQVRLSHSREQTIPLTLYHHTLRDLGYHEAITYSFVDHKLQKIIEPRFAGLALLNPISADMDVMRVSLWPGLLAAIRYNQNRQQQRVRLFEIGMRFIKEGANVVQETTIAGVASGSALPVQWGVDTREIDFFDVKGDVEQLLALTRRSREFQFVETSHPALHPGKAADIFCDKKLVGHVGLVNPALYQPLDIRGPVALFEVKYSALCQAVLPTYRPISKFPDIKRDIAITVESSITAQAIFNIINDTAGELLQEITLFDVYTGKGIPEQHKSMALTLSLQAPERTLVDEEVNAIINRVVSQLEQLVNARLRD